MRPTPRLPFILAAGEAGLLILALYVYAISNITQPALAILGITGAAVLALVRSLAIRAFRNAIASTLLGLLFAAATSIYLYIQWNQIMDAITSQLELWLVWVPLSTAALALIALAFAADRNSPA